MRRLKQTLMAGGVVYPAGTSEADIEVDVVRDDVWEEHDGDDVPVDEDWDHPVTRDLRATCEYLVRLHREDRDVPVAELLDQTRDSLFGPRPAPSGDDIVDAEIVDEPTEDSGDESEQDDASDSLETVEVEPVDWSTKNVGELRTELARRNQERDDAGDPPLGDVASNKAALAELLTADDTAQVQAD